MDSAINEDNRLIHGLGASHQSFLAPFCPESDSLCLAMMLMTFRAIDIDSSVGADFLLGVVMNRDEMSDANLVSFSLVINSSSLDFREAISATCFSDFF